MKGKFRTVRNNFKILKTLNARIKNIKTSKINPNQNLKNNKFNKTEKKHRIICFPSMSTKKYWKLSRNKWLALNLRRESFRFKFKIKKPDKQTKSKKIRLKNHNFFVDSKK